MSSKVASSFTPPLRKLMPLPFLLIILFFIFYNNLRWLKIYIKVIRHSATTRRYSSRLVRNVLCFGWSRFDVFWREGWGWNCCLLSPGSWVWSSNWGMACFVSFGWRCRFLSLRVCSTAVLRCSWSARFLFRTWIIFSWGTGSSWLVVRSSSLPGRATS